MKHTISHIKLTQIKFRITQERVRKLTGMNEDEYINLIVDRGIDYLEQVLGCDQYGRDVLAGEDLFWSWWNNHWHRRDMRFLTLYKRSGHGRNARAVLKELYDSHHSLGRLEVRPNRAILESGFNKMISRMIRPESSKQFNQP